MSTLYRKALALLASKARPWLAAHRAQVRAWLTANLPEVLAVGGSSAITNGAGQIYPPAGWIVGGAFLITAALLVVRARELARLKVERAKRERDR